MPKKEKLKVVELFAGVGDAVFGGKHYVYVFRNNTSSGGSMPAYDGGSFIESSLSSGSATGFNNVWRSCMWVGMPLLNEGQEILASDLRIKIRVSSEYQKYSHNVGNLQNTGNTLFNMVRSPG